MRSMPPCEAALSRTFGPAVQSLDSEVQCRLWRVAEMRNAVLTLLVSAALAYGQSAKPEADRRQAILDYQLNLKRATQLITAMAAMTKYVASLPDFNERMKRSLTMTPAEQLAKIEADRQAMSILTESGLTAREYIVGVPALRMALLAAQGMSPSAKIIVSPANLEFAKANLAQLKPKMDEADGIRSGK